MRTLEDYFHEELTRLHHDGAELARQRPDLAPFLGLPGQDPDVERLLEGVALLCAQIHARLDDELPELSQSLLELAAPQQLQPVPALGMLHCQPMTAAILQPQCLRAGSLFHATSQDALTLRTLQDGWVYPAELAACSFGPTHLQTELRLFQPTPLAGIDWSRLSFWLSDGLGNAKLLYAYLHQHLAGIEILTPQRHALPAATLRWPDLQTRAPLLGAGIEGGALGLIDDLYHLPASLLCFQLDVPCLNDAQPLTTIGLRLHFTQPLPAALHHSARALQINLFPCANLTTCEAEPIVLDGRRSSYPLYLPAGSDTENWIYRLRKVTLEVNGQRTRLAPLLELSPDDTHLGYQLRQQQDTRQRLRYRLQLGADPRLTEHDRAPLLSIELDTCSPTASEQLGPDAGFRPGVGSLSCLSAKLASTLTPCLPPVLTPAAHWQTLGQLQSASARIWDRPRLLALLRTRHRLAQKDPSQRQRLQQQLAAIIDVAQTRDAQWLTHGGLPQQHTRITLDQQAFGGVGETELFGCVLAAALSRLCPLNTQHHLTFLYADTGEQRAWPCR